MWKESVSGSRILAEGVVNAHDSYGVYPVSIQATVELAEHDAVGIKLVDGSLYGDGSLLTVFTGFLVQIS